MTRRWFLRAGVAAATCVSTWSKAVMPRLVFGDARLQQVYEAALAGLQRNVQTVPSFSRPVLFEGAEYGGVWLECAPYEGLVYFSIAPDVAINNHQIFFDLQREDGYLPCYVRSTVGTSQIQMVVPIAATAWDLYRRNRNSAFLEQAYRAGSRWDNWLMRYRNTRGTGLCEAFCTYDTGHDNSPRFAGKPNRCRNGDARLCPKVDGLPYLAPDLSATVYGGRIALAAMAAEMGHSSEQADWLQRAAAIRKVIIDRLYDAHDGAFYDVDSNDRFVRIRGDVITRVMGEHVPSQESFMEVYRLQLRNPEAFWTPYPFPSIAINDPMFVRPIPRNSWGGASQALTALRTPRWMEYYGKYADLTQLMMRWTEAIVRAGEFLQQMDPETGEFTPAKTGYSPAMLVLFDFAHRLYGVRAQDSTLEWNCRIPANATECVAVMPAPGGDAELRNTRSGSVLSIGGKQVAKVRGEMRLVTTPNGSPLRLIGTAPHTAEITVAHAGREISYTIQPDQIIDVQSGHR